MAKKENKKNDPAETTNIVTIEESGPCKKKISIEIPEGKIKETFDQQYYELRKDAEVPGFRKGRAPRRLLEKRFGKDVAEQTKLKLLAGATDDAIKDNDIQSLGEPDIDHEAIEIPETGSLKFDFEIEVRPTFDLPELEGIPVEKPKMEVTDETIESEIAELQKRMGKWQPKDGNAAIDDQIVADVIIKNEQGEEEKKENTEIAIREKGLAWKVPAENLGELLTGAKTGDVKKTTVDIPATYFDENYRGKKVDIEIKVNDIKELVPAELNQELFDKIGVKDLDELKDALRQRDEQNLERQTRSAMQQSIHKYLLDNIDFDLPADVVADQSQQLLQRQYVRLLQQGSQAAEITEQLDQLKAASENQAKTQLKSFFIIDEIANNLQIETTEEEINGYIAQMAMYRQTRPEKMREQMAKDGSLSQAALEIREQKCIDKLLESAKITEVEPKKQKTAKKTTKKKTATKKKTKTNDSEKKAANAKKTAPKKKTAKKTTTKKKSTD